MKRRHILGTGLSGLVGSKFVQLNNDRYHFQNLDLSTGTDITDAKQVFQAVEKSPADTVIHFAAFTDVNKAHQQNGDTHGSVYAVNVKGTKNVITAAKQTGKYFIHISTAYVFDGEKEGYYTEEDRVNPIEWYGQTKAYAEELVQKIDESASILRIDQPYRDDKFVKQDILHRIKKGLQEGTLSSMFTDHTFTPTHIEKFCEFLNAVITFAPSGIFHATTDPKTSDYEFALWVKNKFKYSTEVKKGSLKEYLQHTSRPYQKNTALKTTKLQQFISTH